MQTRVLHSNWQFISPDFTADFPRSQLPELKWMPAQVPGHVHRDLQAYGVIGDPFYRMNELGLGWVDESRWTYRTEFTWEPNEELPNRVLRFEGLDTVCEIFLNGALIGRSDNMFLPLEIDVTEHLEAGTNELKIEFQSAVKVGIQRRRAYMEAERLPWTTPWFDERAFVRKAQYMSGWDWGPRLVSAGIWQPVSLIESRGRILSASFLTERQSNGRFLVRAEVETTGEGDLEVAFMGQIRKPGETLEWDVEGELWWPVGEGAPVLHPASATLSTGDRVDKQIGLRTIRLLQEPDAMGRSFEFEVNGRPVYARGANWIPDDSFPSQVDPESVAARVAGYARLNMNMLRVWGGGLYESEAFYNACDQNGVMVWQDFPFACMYYPDHQAVQEEVTREARHHVRRLRDRASLALWCGNNENEAMYRGAWGGKDKLPRRYYGEVVYNQTLPAAVRQLDAQTPYIRTSPVGLTSEDPEISENGERFGDSHYWDVWHGRGDWRHYTDSETRFSSEYGFAAAPSLAVWRDALAPADWHPESPAVQWHDKTGKKEGIFKGYVEEHYPVSETLEDWTYYSQLNQRDALRYGVEHFRRSPFCRGSLIWQINDCWPVQSWAMEDYRRLLKPAGQELVRLYAPVMLSIWVGEAEAEVWLINDSPEVVVRPVQVNLVDLLSATLTGIGEMQVTLGPGERKCVQQIPLGGLDVANSALCAEIVGEPSSVRWEFLPEPKDFAWQTPDVAARVEGDTLFVTVQGLAADLVVGDPTQPHAVLGPWTGLAGWTAVTAMNQTLTYPLAATPNSLRLRTLAGASDLSLG